MSVQVLSLNDGQIQLLEQVITQESRQPFSDFTAIEQMMDHPKRRYWSLISQIFWKPESKWLPLLAKINQTFIRLEQEGVLLFDLIVPGCREQWEVYKERYQRCFRVAEKVLELSQGGLVSTKLKELQSEVRCRLVGCRYQLGEENGGLSPLKYPHQALFEKLQTLAKQWKNEQDLAANKELNGLDLSQLKELAQYPEWVKVVIENPFYLKEIFSWCLKDDGSVEVLVKCYETRKTIKASLLSSYLGYGRNQDLISRENEVLAFRDLSTRVTGQAKRVLTIAIYHGSFSEFEPDQQERVNILDPNQEILFKQGNRKITVRQFFQESARKNETEVDTNVCVWGVVNRHPVYGVRQGNTETYDASHMARKDWIQCVPPIAVAADEELINRYGTSVNRRETFFKVMSSRQFLDGFNASRAHCYLLIYIPMKEGNWKVLSVGFFAYRFQKGFLDQFLLAGYTAPRILSEIDQNHCYTMRRRAEAQPIFPVPQHMEKFLTLLAKKRTGGVFQFSGRNCAYPLQKYAGKCFPNLPNFFKMRLTKGKLGIGPFDQMLQLADRQSTGVRQSFVGVLHRTLGSRRVLHVHKEDPTKEGYSVYNYVRKYIDDWKRNWFYHFAMDLFQWLSGFPGTRQVPQASKLRDYSVHEYFQKYDEDIYNPPYLHHQIETKALEGTIYWSLTDEKLFQKKRN